MTFPSMIFLFLFLPCTLGLYIVVKPKARRVLFLLFSLLFYAWGGIGDACLLLLYVCLVYALGRYIGAVEKEHRTRRLTESMLLLGLLLFYYKYYGFFLDNLFAVLSVPVSYEVLPMPLGISFITFTAMAYLIDIRREVIQPASFLQLAVYLTFFPKLIMGPIERYDGWERQLKSTWQPAKLEEGAIRFLMGLSQKLLLADALAPLWSYTSTHSVSTASAWLGLLAYTFQIYFDFSGYSDMAIGLGKMLGFEFLENFNYPYISRSITEFWRRWHISLSTWFRDYVYIPLGGSRHGRGKQIRNLMIVWLLPGFWHGASWNFMLWGIYFGVILILEKFVLKPILERLPKVLQHGYALVLILLGWVLFAFTDLDAGLTYLKTMFGWGSVSLINARTLFYLRDYGLLLIIMILASTPLGHQLYETKIRGRRWEGVMPLLIAAGLILCTAYLVDASYNPFLYFRF